MCVGQFRLHLGSKEIEDEKIETLPGVNTPLCSNNFYRLNGVLVVVLCHLGAHRLGGRPSVHLQLKGGGFLIRKSIKNFHPPGAGRLREKAR